MRRRTSRQDIPPAPSTAPMTPEAPQAPANAPVPADVPTPGVPQVPANAPMPEATPAPAAAMPEAAPAPVTSMPLPDPIVPGRHHVNVAYIWLGGSVWLVTLLIILLGSNLEELIALARSSVADITVWIIVTIATAAAIVYLWFWLSWRNLTYELTPTELWLFSGIIVKKRRHVPYQRVQAVNQNASLIKRVFGLTTAQIDTAGGASNEGVRIPYIRKTDADLMRRELFRRKRILLDGGSLEPDGSAVVGGWRYPSVWAHINAGGNPYGPIPPIPLQPSGIPGGQGEATVASAGPFPAAPAGGAGASVLAAVPGAPLPATSGGASNVPFPTAQAIPPHVAMPAGVTDYNVLDGIDRAIGNVGGLLDQNRPDLGYVRYEMGLSNKELALAAVSGGGMTGSVLSLIIVAILAGVSWATAAGNPAVVLSVDLAGAVLVVAAVFAVIAAFLGDVIRLGGFRARRYETRLEVESGLLGRTSHGLDIDRVQSLIVRQTFIRRLIGYCEVCVTKVSSSSSSGDSSNDAAQDRHGVVIHPFVKVDRVPEIVNGMLPEFNNAPLPTVTLPEVALRRGIIRQAIIRNPLFWIAVCLVVVLVPFVPGWAWFFETTVADVEAVIHPLLISVTVVALVSMVLLVGNAVLWYRESRFGYNRRFLTIVGAGYRAEREVIPRRKIQFAWTRVNPFQRMAKVCTINVRTAAGVGGKTTTLWDVEQDAADRWMAWVRPGGSSVTVAADAPTSASPNAASTALEEASTATAAPDDSVRRL